MSNDVNSFYNGGGRGVECLFITKPKKQLNSNQKRVTALGFGMTVALMCFGCFCLLCFRFGKKSVSSAPPPLY